MNHDFGFCFSKKAPSGPSVAQSLTPGACTPCGYTRGADEGTRLVSPVKAAGSPEEYTRPGGGRCTNSLSSAGPAGGIGG